MQAQSMRNANIMSYEDEIVSIYTPSTLHAAGLQVFGCPH